MIEIAFRTAGFLILGLVLAPACSVSRAQDAGATDTAIRASVVKISVTARPPDLLRPWMKQSPRESSGTGWVVEPNRILTNAHVVLYASEISVEANQSGEKFQAKVEAISPAMDLALLSVEDESFFKDRPPIPRADKLPSVKEQVTVYGYPTGGTSQSITQGIVSRIEFAPYSSQAAGLRIQIDAAINPGNSGGPAVVGGKVIGVTFSRLQQADNIGYIIPTEEVELFLRDASDGTVEGKPMLLDKLQTLENPALRARLGVGREVTGLVVHEAAESVDGNPLKKWDVVSKIGPHDIDNLGQVKVDDGLSLAFQYYVQHLARDGKLPLTIVRDGKEQEIELPVIMRRPMLIQELAGGYPSYFIYGPLVFSAATDELVSALERAGNMASVLSRIGSPLITRRGDAPKTPGEQLVIVGGPMFPHKVGRGYSNPFSKVVRSVNGTPITSLAQLVQTLRDAKAEFIEIEFEDDNSETLVFNRKEVEEATEEILSDNGIRKGLSDDLLEAWERKRDDKAEGGSGR